MTAEQWSFQSGTAKPLQIVLAVGILLDRHLAFDPGERNVGLRTAKLLQCGFGDSFLACHASGSSEHAVGADKIAALPNAVAG